MESRCNELEVASVMIEDSEIDVNGCSFLENNVEVPGDRDPDATEYSSSFGGTVSDSENCSGMSEAEAESMFGSEGCFSPSLEDFDGIFRVRKKKLTSHWRTFIRPLMWRCKWAELKMKEIETRASKYSRSLETVEQSKRWRTIQSPIGQCGSRSIPFSQQFHRKMLVKRRKRKRVENITDVPPYMMHQNLFSYLENRRPDPDGTILPDDVSLPDKKRNLNNELGNASNQSSFSIRECDMSLEQVLKKIELMQSCAQKLKGQLEMMISQNAAKFSSFENLNLLAPCEAQTSCAPSPTVSANNGDIMSMCALYPTAQRSTDFDIGDLVLPESVVSNFGEAIPGPDVIESTAGLLSAADVTLYQPLIGDSKEIEEALVSKSKGDGHDLANRFHKTSAEDPCRHDHHRTLENNRRPPADNPPHHRHHQDHSKLRKCTSLRVASSFTRACLCVPLSSYNEVFRSEINYRPPHPTPLPRRSNSYPRSRSVNSSLSPSAGGSAQPSRSVEVTPATAVVMRRREVFRGKSLREDVVMRRFVTEEEAATVQARRRNQMEAVRRRSLARRKKVGRSRLSRMVMAGD